MDQDKQIAVDMTVAMINAGLFRQIDWIKGYGKSRLTYPEMVFLTYKDLLERISSMEPSGTISDNGK